MVSGISIEPIPAVPGASLVWVFPVAFAVALFFFVLWGILRNAWVRWSFMALAVGAVVLAVVFTGNVISSSEAQVQKIGAENIRIVDQIHSTYGLRVESYSCTTNLALLAHGERCDFLFKDQSGESVDASFVVTESENGRYGRVFENGREYRPAK